MRKHAVRTRQVHTGSHRMLTHGGSEAWHPGIRDGLRAFGAAFVFLGTTCAPTAGIV